METLGNTAEQNLTKETGQATLNKTHARRGTIKIKLEVTKTETRTKASEQDTEAQRRPK